MSRKEWDSKSRTLHSADDSHRLRNPVRFSAKTSDPQAADYDEAQELFSNGMKLARIGDFDAAVPQIATAYLLDGRSVNFMPKLPDDINADSKNFILDAELLQKLIHNDTTTFGCDVLHIILAMHLGAIPEHGQQFIAIAMVRINKLITYLENHPETEDPNGIVLGGCLSRKALLYQKSSLHMALGDYKSAMKDLTRALKLDDFYTQARESRACVWAGRNLKDAKTVHAEFKRIIGENHVDNRGNEVAYAFLALKTLGNSSLGTFRDAKAWYDKMMAATERRDEIYGKRTYDKLPPAVQDVQRTFYQYGNLDVLDLVAGVERVSVGGKKNKRACLKCGATTKTDGGKLSMCTKCKVANYCSRDCQVSDWKAHKKLCKILREELDNTRARNKPTSEEGKAEQTNSLIAKDEPEKEVKDEMTASIEYTKRLETEFKHQFQKYGDGFSKWWTDMSIKERKRFVQDVTDDSIPLKEPSQKDIAKLLRAETPVKSRALFDYNVESLCGSKGKLLQEMKEWAHNSAKKEEENIRISTDLRLGGIFPDIFGQLGGELAFVTPPTKEEAMGPLTVFNNTTPAEDLERYRGYIQQCVLWDASAAHYAICRKSYSLALFSKIFDEYQIMVRRVPPINPMERLYGCGHCGRSCQEETAIKCQVCEVCWFCCNGCMVAAGHTPCPYKGEQESKAFFNKKGVVPWLKFKE